MIYQVFSVYDSKSESFSTPTFSRAVGEMLRSFQTAANSTENQFHKHSGDFTLFQIGEYDDSSGHLAPFDTPISLGLAQSFIEQEIK